MAGAPGVGLEPAILPDPRGQRNTYAENSWEPYQWCLQLVQPASRLKQRQWGPVLP